MVSHAQRTLISMFFSAGVAIPGVKVIAEVIVALFTVHVSPSPATPCSGSGVPGLVVSSLWAEPEFNVFSE